jgi:hypothetical protein
MKAAEGEALGIVTTIGDCGHGWAQCAVLGRALQRTWPDTPRAVIGHPDHIRGLDRHGWDLVATTDPNLQKGFESKLHLHEFTPYAETLFLDSDVLPLSPRVPIEDLIRPLRECGAPVAYFGHRVADNAEYQGTYLNELRAKRGIASLFMIRGGGHYYWRRGNESAALFRTAQRICAENWPEILRFFPVVGPRSHASDEVLIAVALALEAPEVELPDRGCIVTSGEPIGPEAILLHFMVDGNPIMYCKLAAKLLGSGSLPAYATVKWVQRMTRKAVIHYWRGGTRRARNSRDLLKRAP